MRPLMAASVAAAAGPALAAVAGVVPAAKLLWVVVEPVVAVAERAVAAAERAVAPVVAAVLLLVPKEPEVAPVAVGVRWPVA